MEAHKSSESSAEKKKTRDDMSLFFGTASNTTGAVNITQDETRDEANLGPLRTTH